MSDMAGKTPYTVSQSEPFQGRTPRIPATIKTYEELSLYFARMGVFGDGAYLSVILSLGVNPNLAIYLPEDGVAAGEVEGKRDELTTKVVPQLNDAKNNNPFKNKQDGVNPYSYNRKNPYSSDYLRFVVKGRYSGIAKKAEDAFRKVRSIYHSSSGVFGIKKTYDGKGAPSTKNKNQIGYSTHPHRNLEEMVA